MNRCEEKGIERHLGESEKVETSGDLLSLD